MKAQDEFENNQPLIELASTFFKTEIPEPIPMLEGLINEGAPGMLAGDTGGGKSWLTKHFAYAVAAGKPCAPWGKGAGVPVLYVDGEMGKKLFHKRLSQIRNRDTKPETIALGEINIHILGRAWSKEIDDLDKRKVQNYLSEYIEMHGIKLLIVDNLDTLCPEALTKQASWKLLIDWVQELSKKKVAVILVHHNNKAGKQYGSSIKTRQMHFVMSLKKSARGKSQEQTTFLLSMDKERDEGIGLEQDTCFVVKTGYDATTKKVVTTVMLDELYFQKEAREEEIKQHFLEGKNGKEIAELMKISEASVTRVKKILTQQGELE